MTDRFSAYRVFTIRHVLSEYKTIFSTLRRMDQPVVRLTGSLL